MVIEDTVLYHLDLVFIYVQFYINQYPPRCPVREEGVDGGVGDGVLVHGLVVRHALVLEPVAPEDLLRHVGGADLQCWELEWLHHGHSILLSSLQQHTFSIGFSRNSETTSYFHFLFGCHIHLMWAKTINTRNKISDT